MSDDSFFYSSGFAQWSAQHDPIDQPTMQTLRNEALAILVKSVNDGEITTIDGVDSPLSMTIKAHHQLTDFEMNGHWMGSSQAWVCPCCGRSKFHISRVGRKNQILAKLVIHHDHMGEALKAAFHVAFAEAGTQDAQIEGKRLVERIGSAFAAYEELLICEDCNNADTEAKKQVEAPSFFSFSIGQIRSFIQSSAHRPHQHLRVVTVRGFPTSTWPGLLDDLNRLGFAYRWSTRFLCLDKAEAEKEMTRLRRQWFAKRKNVIALLRETIFQQESPLVDTDASNKAMDADAALQELGSDQVAFGYMTATVTVMDADAAKADERLRMVERTIQSRGFVTIPETLNAVEAWLSSIPGHAYANVRQPSISTLNLAHLMPLSAVWAGPEKNKHLDGPPLIVTRTDGDTPFRLVTHIGDVGHTLVVGPTGMGKSVLLATLAMQFRRYRGSRIFAFDMGRSMRATILGLGGEHYDLGSDGDRLGNTVAFQPLARIDRENYRTWAAEWVEGRLLHEGIAVGPDEKAAVWSALGSLAGAPVEQRTLTGLSALLQSNALRQTLAPYVLGGAHGRLLDADHDRLGSADVQGFEMEELMPSKAAVLAVLGYLFARFDERFDGAPTLLILDESWLFLDDPVFAARIRQWLKTLRKKNVSVIFATQSLADIKDSSIAPAIIESCASRIFLPNPQATEPQIRTIYEGFGLNSRQIEIVAIAEPKRDYYYQSRLGNRLFDLDLGLATLAFAGASTPQEQRDIDHVLRNAGTPGFAGAWLRHNGLDWAADLMPSFLTPSEIQS